MRFIGSFLLLFLLGVISGKTSEQGKPGNPDEQDAALWGPLQFLVGKWTGEGTGAPGEGTGGFSFTWDLGQKILVRRNHADYPATNDRPAFTHLDFMVIYGDAAGKTLKAIYFDNERHVINYSVLVQEGGDRVQFISDAIPSVPRYRFTYIKAGVNALKLKFEIAPPGKPDSFATYIEASARRD